MTVDDKPDLFALGGSVDPKARTNTQERRQWQPRWRSDTDLSDGFKKWMGAGPGSSWRGPAQEDRERARRLDSKAATSQLVFEAGQCFRVLKVGGQLQTMFAEPGKAQCWPLSPGNIIMCFGASAPFGEAPHFLITFGGSKGQVLAPCVVFAPSTGTHRRPYPEPGYLELVQ